MFDFKDLTITTFSVNGHIPESRAHAVRITHNPTGISVTCRRHASSIENTNEALEVLERQVARLKNKKFDK